MKPLTKGKIVNNHNNVATYITMSGVNEMLSSKAVMQSVKNGFTKEQHIEAVQNIHKIFPNAIYKETQTPVHAKDYVKSYSVYLGNFKDSNAVISIEERKAKNNIFYFLKLESLQPNN